MEFLNYEQTALSKLKDRYSEAKRDPTLLVKASLETVQEITEGRAVLVDATLPAVMLLEMAAAQTAACVQENLALLRRQYPSLAMTEDDLYLHMSDEDYINRFAKPSTPARFTLAILASDFFREAVYDSVEDVHKLIIPRDTSITVDNIVFTTLYPIVLRRFNNGILQISYDAEIQNPIHSLKSTIIEFVVRKGSSQEEWVFFDIEALQIEISTTYFNVDKTYNFSKEIPTKDQYCHARVFYRNSNTSNDWIEVRTTHTDQVFDVTVPTAVLKVRSNSLTVEIPVVYTTTGLIVGELRVDIYTTKGELSVDLKNYRQDSYIVNMKAIDEKRDLNVYTTAMTNISYYAASTDVVTGGTDAITFEELRERVIFNSVGPQSLPITNVHLTAEADNNGFEIVKNVDVLTNRIFLATRKLPKPKQSKLITAANVGIVGYKTDYSDLLTHPSVKLNGDRLTILSKTVWIDDNGSTKLVSKTDLDQLYALGQTSMVNRINSNQYLYTPFYYVLDSSGEEFEVRSYALDQPYAYGQSFVSQNQTLQLSVNTASYRLDKVQNGYALKIKTVSGNHYRNLEDSQVGVQLAFKPKGENTYAYINGVQEAKDTDGNRVFRFDIETNYDIDSEDLITITNCEVEGITNYDAKISLETEFEVLHYTTSVTAQYRPDATDEMLGKFILPAASVGNSRELFRLHFGDALSNLWRRSRSYTTQVHYKLHEVNVPLLYETDVYDQDPVTGSIFDIVDGAINYRYLHRAGDPVLDTEGNPVYKYKIGDVVMDENGNPVVTNVFQTGRDIDILVVDGRYFFADDTATREYRSEIESTLTSWIVDDVETLEQKLLEQSKIFLYPKTTLGTIQVNTENGIVDQMTAEQAFTLDLYVPYSIYNDNDIREMLRSATISLLDRYIGLAEVNMTAIRDELRSMYGDSVAAFKITGLGGSKDYQLVKVISDRNKLCLKKQLVIQADKTMVVQDDVVINFKMVS